MTVVKNTDMSVSVVDAIQNFSRVADLADEHGEVLVFNGSRPQYKLINLDVEPDLELTDDEKIDVVARRIMDRFKPAFLELAK